MSIDDAVRQFRRAAIEKGDFAAPAAEDAALHESMVAAWQALERRGPAGRSAFRALLCDDSRHVRGWVASQLLALGDESGVRVLESDAQLGGLGGLASRTVLAEWKSGRLEPPLGRAGA